MWQLTQREKEEKKNGLIDKTRTGSDRAQHSIFAHNSEVGNESNVILSQCQQ